MDTPGSPLLPLSDERPVILLLASPQAINQMNTTVIRDMIGQGCTPIVMTINRPYSVLKKAYETAGIDTGRVYVIDAVTLYSGGSPDQGARNVRYIRNPANLTEIGMAFIDILTIIPDQKMCVLFDSVSMLLVYIDAVNTTKFIHFLVNKLKISQISGIFLAVEKGLDPVVLSQVTTFVDRAVDFDKIPVTP